MTRVEILTILIGRSRTHGFEFRRWYTSQLSLPWISAEAAIQLLSQQRRYVALLFAHEFARSFWKAGEDITFAVPANSFQRRMADGTLKTVTRQPYMRRSGRRDAWLFHLREMAAAEEPLRYIRKYLNVDEDLTEDLEMALADEDIPIAPKKPPPKRSRTKPLARPIPTDLPNFLRRPYVP
jgi:hypothetical protein